jgi:hypothetical protein
MDMTTCRGTTKKGQPCRNSAIEGTFYCRYHKPNEANDLLEIYSRLKKATPEEKTDIVLQLIEKHPEGKLELPEQGGMCADLSNIDLSVDTLKGKRSTPSIWDTSLVGC